MRNLLLAILSAALLSGCVVRSSRTATGPSAFLLSQRTSEEGVETKFRVQASRTAAPSIVRVETRSQEVAFLGINVRSLDRAHAQTLGLEPWRGVVITGVTGKSAAASAGLHVGEVLLSLADEELTNLQQFQEAVAALLTPGVSTRGTRLRKVASGEYVEDTFEITPGSRSIDDSVTEHFALSAPEEIVQRTGMQVATVEAELARETGMGDASFALVTSVIAGASAYDEGIRRGDRILECNGAPVTNAGSVLQALDSGSSRLDVLVNGPLGEHRASLMTDEDVDARRRFHIPIIIDHSKRVNSTRTSFLDFIFQFGYNYRRTVSDSATREPSVESYFSLFPLGMFEFERSPEESRNTLFWIISWSTER